MSKQVSGMLQRAGEIGSRRKGVASLVFAGVFAVATCFTLALPNLYRARATVLLESERMDPEGSGELERRLHTVSQRILSRSRLLELADRFDLYPGLRRRVSPEILVQRVREDVTLDLNEVSQPWGRSATIGFTVGFRGTDPGKAAAVTNALAALYIEEDLRLRTKQATGVTASLRAQLDDAKRQLDVQDRRMAEFRNRHLGELPQQMEANLATLERLNAQLRVVRDDLVRANDRRSTLMREVGAAQRSGGSDPAEARLASLRQELATLQRLYTDRYPDIVRLKAEIAVVERQKAAVLSTAVAPRDLAAEELRQVEEDIRSLQAEQVKLRGALAEYQRRVESAPQREQEALALARDYAGTKALYETLLKQHEEAQLSERAGEPAHAQQFRILDPAIPQREPAGPNRQGLLLVGLFLAVCAAVGAMALAEELDTSFHSLDDLRTFTRVPVLVSIPRLAARADAFRLRWGVVGATVAAVLVFALLAGASYRMADGNDHLVSTLMRGRS